jgi:hypothetical protein
MERACPSTNGIPSRAQRSASQVPGKETLDGDDDIGAIRCNSLEECLWTGLHVLVEQDLPSLIQDADIHAAGMPIDAAIRMVLCGVESPELSSSFGCLHAYPAPAYHRGMRGRRPP